MLRRIPPRRKTPGFELRRCFSARAILWIGAGSRSRSEDGSGPLELVVEDPVSSDVVELDVVVTNVVIVDEGEVVGLVLTEELVVVEDVDPG